MTSALTWRKLHSIVDLVIKVLCIQSKSYLSKEVKFTQIETIFLLGLLCNYLLIKLTTMYRRQ